MYQNMLITGCGGDIAQSLARIARECSVARNLIGCDTNSDHAGNAYFEVCRRVSDANQDDYLQQISRFISDYNIDVIVPMSEAEIGRFVGGGVISEFEGAAVIAANERAIDVGLDKFATFQMLARRGLNPPWTRIVGVDPPDSVPCIIKPRFGRGSKGFNIVETDEEINRLTKLRAGDIWQELLVPDEEEYTCGLFRSRLGETRTIILKRKLKGGQTQSGEVILSKTMDALLSQIGAAVELVGSINVQLRLTKLGPQVFEINPRFSSTVGFRHKLGFRDFIWTLQDKQGLALEEYVPPRAGIRFYRTSSEVIVE
jgi:carbamoyl-phosphate synthase large subunit